MCQILDLSDFNPIGNIIIPFVNESSTDRTKISLVAYYSYNLITNKEHVINFKHNDFPKIEITPELSDCYVYRQDLMKLSNNYDLELCYWWLTEEQLPNFDITKFNFYKKILGKIDYRFIPFTILLDHAREIKLKFIGKFKDLNFDKDLFIQYNNNIFNIFKAIEMPGCNIDRNHIKAKTHIKTNRLWSNYKLYTTTGRPSNTDHGFNLAALNKGDGTRNIIIPDEDSILMEWDYSAFHIRLISKLINYELPEGNLHEYFGSQYFGTAFLNQEQYDEAKAISFRAVYGTIDEAHLKIPFYKEVSKYREKLYNEYKFNGFIRSVIFQRPIGLGKNLPEHKLFNYLLQNFETEFNSLTIKQLLNYLLNKKSKIILYTYDSFLLNINKEDGPEIIKGISNIIYRDKFVGTINYGKSYGQMIPYHTT